MTLPLIGAAMSTPELEIYQDLILSENRDLELQDFCMDKVLEGDWKAIATRSKALLSGYTGRLGIHGPFWGLNLANPDAAVRKIVTHRMLQGLEVCEFLGATQMVVHSPYSIWDYNNLDNDYHGRAYQRVLDLVHDTMDSVVARAENIGVTLVVENIEDKDPDIRRVLVEDFSSEALALSIDTGHAHYAHGSTGAPPVDFYVNRAGNLLQHVHLQDADGHADRHWAIGEGTILWHSVFRALAQLESQPRLILELRDKAGLMPSLAWLKAQGLGR